MKVCKPALRGLGHESAESWHHGLVFVIVNLAPLVPKGYQCELFEVGHSALYGAMGTVVERGKTVKINDFSEKMKNKMLYHLKNHGNDCIALRYGLVITVQYFMPLTSGKPEPHSFLLLSDLRTHFEVYIVGCVLL